MLLGLATVELMRMTGSHDSFSHLAALAIVSTNVFIQQSVNNKNDLSVAALFLTSLLFGLRWGRAGRLVDLVLGACAFGLLVGIKYYALGYAAVVWGVTGIVWQTRGVRSVITGWMVWACGALLLGGYWYLRNFAVTGTPFYPLGISQRTDVLHEIYPNTWSSTFLGNPNPEVFPLAVRAVWRMAGPVHVAALLLFPLVMIGLLISCIIQLPRRQSEGVARGAIVLAAMGSLLVLLITPWATETEPGTLNHLRGGYLPVRFGQCFLGMAVIALAVFLNDCGKCLCLPKEHPVHLGNTLTCLVFATALGWQLVTVFRSVHFRPGQLSGTIVIAVCLLLATVLVWQVRQLDCWSRWIATAVGTCLVAVGVVWGVNLGASTWHGTFVSSYDLKFHTKVFSTLSKLPPEETRVCTIASRCYPFFGSRRQFRVCRPERILSYQNLAHYLRDHRVSVLITFEDDDRAYPRYRNIGQYVSSHPQAFQPVIEDSHFLFVRVHNELLVDHTDNPQGHPDRK